MNARLNGKKEKEKGSDSVSFTYYGNSPEKLRLKSIQENDAPHFQEIFDDITNQIRFATLQWLLMYPRALKGKQRTSPTQKEHFSSENTVTLPNSLQMQIQKPGMVKETSS